MRCKETDYILSLLAGVCLLLAGIFILSFFHAAYPLTLLVLLSVCGGVALFFNRFSFSVLKLYHHARPDDSIQGFLLGVGVAWVFVLAARTQNVIGYDSVWYLSRSDTLLAPAGTIFQNLNLVSPVHYFPKLWETLLLPITAFDQLRVQAGIGIALLVLSVVLVWKLCEALAMPKIWRYMAALFVITVPAWANSSLQVKSDVICVFFLLVMLLTLNNWFSERKLSGLLCAMAAASLAVSCKYTAIPFVFVGFLFVLIEFFVRAKSSPEASGDPLRRGALVVFCLAVCVALIFLFRTWLLTGVPTIGPDPLLEVWRWLGFTEQEPAGTLNWTRPQIWSEVPRLFYEWLFAPNYMNHIRISWQGNFWFLFAMMGLLAATFGMKSRLAGGSSSLRYLMLVSSLLGVLIAVAWRYHSRGGDGNYYMYPLAVVTCLSLASVAGRLGHSRCFQRVAVVSVLMFSAFHAEQSFIVASWSKPGTRVMDMNFSGQPFEGGVWRSSLLRRSGLEEIGEYLESKPADTRVVAYGFVDEHVALLPVPTENLQPIIYARNAYGENVDAVIDYLTRFDISYLLLSTDQKQDKHFRLLNGLRNYAQAHGWIGVEGQGGELYKIPPNTIHMVNAANDGEGS